MPKVALIGAGNMGAPLAEAWLKSKLVSAADLLIVETDPSKLPTELKKLSKPILDQSIAHYEIIIFAVKPQDSPGVFKGIQEFCKNPQKKQIFVSIMAGVTSEVIAKKIGSSHIVRCMPNLPLRVGKAVTAYWAHSSVDKVSLDFIEKLFSVCGVTVHVKDEALVDAATAFSGSGPAYLYYLVQHWIETATELGYSSDQAEILVRETVSGALELWKSSGQSPEELRKAVTSKGGTTQAAIDEFEKGQLGKTFKAGLKAALMRGKELSEKASKG